MRCPLRAVLPNKAFAKAYAQINRRSRLQKLHAMRRPVGIATRTLLEPRAPPATLLTKLDSIFSQLVAATGAETAQHLTAAANEALAAKQGDVLAD